MAGREPAPEELAAADVVAGALGGRWESRDGEDDPPGMHDFDVILPDGRCIALEVTSAIDGAVVALSDAAFGREGRQQRWAAPGLANDWIVTIPQRPVRVADMMSAMLPILEAFEVHGHADVDPRINYAYVSPRSELPAPVVEAARRMVELGVTRARVLAPRAAATRKYSSRSVAGSRATPPPLTDWSPSGRNPSARSSLGLRPTARASATCSSGWTGRNRAQSWPWQRCRRPRRLTSRWR